MMPDDISKNWFKNHELACGAYVFPQVDKTEVDSFLAKLIVAQIWRETHIKSWSLTLNHYETDQLCVPY